MSDLEEYAQQVIERKRRQLAEHGGAPAARTSAVRGQPTRPVVRPTEDEFGDYSLARWQSVPPALWAVISHTRIRSRGGQYQSAMQMPDVVVLGVLFDNMGWQTKHPHHARIGERNFERRTLGGLPHTTARRALQRLERAGLIKSLVGVARKRDVWDLSPLLTRMEGLVPGTLSALPRRD